jgi:hypothetical protein
MSRNSIFILIAALIAFFTGTSANFLTEHATLVKCAGLQAAKNVFLSGDTTVNNTRKSVRNIQAIVDAVVAHPSSDSDWPADLQPCRRQLEDAGVFATKSDDLISRYDSARAYIFKFEQEVCSSGPDTTDSVAEAAVLPLARLLERAVGKASTLVTDVEQDVASKNAVCGNHIWDTLGLIAEGDDMHGEDGAQSEL